MCPFLRLAGGTLPARPLSSFLLRPPRPLARSCQITYWQSFPFQAQVSAIAGPLVLAVSCLLWLPRRSALGRTATLRTRSIRPQAPFYESSYVRPLTVLCSQTPLSLFIPSQHIASIPHDSIAWLPSRSLSASTSACCPHPRDLKLAPSFLSFFVSSFLQPPSCLPRLVCLFLHRARLSFAFSSDCRSPSSFSRTAKTQICRRIGGGAVSSGQHKLQKYQP